MVWEEATEGLSSTVNLFPIFNNPNATSRNKSNNDVTALKVAYAGGMLYKKCAFHDAGRVFPSSVTNTEYSVSLFERHPIEGSVASSKKTMGRHRRPKLRRVKSFAPTVFRLRCLTSTCVYRTWAIELLQGILEALRDNPCRLLDMGFRE